MVELSPLRAVNLPPGISERVLPGRDWFFSFPLDEDRPPESVPADSPTGEGARTLRVLIVEDSLDAAQTLQDLLQSLGYDVSVAYTGPEGLQAALQLHPNVILCDIGLPGLDGYQMAIRLREQPAGRSTRIMAVTGYGGAGDRRRAKEAGFDHHMTKPVDLDELESLLAAEAALLGAGLNLPLDHSGSDCFEERHYLAPRQRTLPALAAHQATYIPARGSTWSRSVRNSRRRKSWCQ